MTEERIAHVNGIEIAYDTFGDPGDPPLVLVMGLGMQLIAWDPDFCTMLAQRGFHVVRFDNRDSGHSTKIDGPRRPRVVAGFLGRTGSAAYTLDDMAADTAGLIEHLGHESAHVAGVSLGGMIAQTLAIRHPDRVRSLASIMSTTGSRLVGQPRLGALAALLRRPPRERERFIDHTVRVFKVIGSPGYPPDDGRLRRIAGAAYDRCHHPVGVERQLLAVAASGNRTPALRDVRTPAVVIHGQADRLIPPSGGRATARAIPGARFVLVPGMGHDLPPALWPRIVDEIVANAQRAGAAPRDAHAA